jgi:micrococcal nuclease
MVTHMTIKPIGFLKKSRVCYERWIAVFCVLILLTSCTPDRVLQYDTANLIRVVDGDTVLVDRGQGNEYLRMIGIDAPESVHPDPNKNSEEGRRSAAFLQSLLKNVTIVYITKDVSETDKYGRLLRYVWLVKPREDTTEIRSGMVNAIMMLEGYASAMTIQPDVRYAELFVKFVREARQNRKGLWE